MKYPSRWGQPGEASSALRHSPAAGRQLPAVPPPPVHTTWEDTTNPSKSYALLHLQSPPRPISLVPLPT